MQYLTLLEELNNVDSLIKNYIGSGGESSYKIALEVLKQLTPSSQDVYNDGITIAIKKNDAWNVLTDGSYFKQTEQGWVEVNDTGNSVAMDSTNINLLPEKIRK